MRKFLGIFIAIASIALACYLGGWLLFVKPIVVCAMAFDTGTLTGTMIAMAIIKCVFAGTVGTLVGYFGVLIGTQIATH